MNNRSILLSIFFFGMSLSASAEWNTEASPVELSTPSEQPIMNIHTCEAGKGKTWVAYTTYTPAYMIDCRIQLIDEDGNRTLGNDGIPLISYSRDLPSTADTFGIVCDDEGNAIICFPSAMDVSSYMPLPRVFKISQSGEFLWGSGKELPIDQENISGQDIYNFSGDLYATWNYTDYSQYASRTCVMRLDSDGNPMWDNYITINGRTADLNESENGFTAIWVENGRAWVQEFDNSGIALSEIPTAISEEGISVTEPYSSSAFLIGHADGQTSLCYTGYESTGLNVLCVTTLDSQLNPSTKTISSETTFSGVRFAELDANQAAVIWQTSDYETGATLHMAVITPDHVKQYDIMAGSNLSAYYATFTQSENIFLIWGEAEGWSDADIKGGLFDLEGNLTIQTKLLSTASDLNEATFTLSDEEVYMYFPYTDSATYESNLMGMRVPISCDFSTSLIERIANDRDDVPAEYFSLDGIRCSGNNLRNGLYIKRTPDGKSKVIINRK